MAFQKAVKIKSNGHVSLFGPPGSGKTWSSLVWASVLRGDGRIAVIDTERGSASKYADDFDFDAERLTSFAPANYAAALRSAAAAKYPVVVIDSLSHAWVGEGGILDQADQKGGKFDVWKTLTPQQRKLIDAILAYPGHVIATMRSKMDYVIEDSVNRQGQTVKTPRKVGLAPVQKDDTEYEFDLVLSLDVRNNARVMKSRCRDFVMDDVIGPLTVDHAASFLAWLDGAAAQAEQPKGGAESSARPSTGTTTRGTSTSAAGPTDPASKVNGAIEDAKASAREHDLRTGISRELERLGYMKPWARDKYMRWAAGKVAVDVDAPSTVDLERLLAFLQEQKPAQQQGAAT